MHQLKLLNFAYLYFFFTFQLQATNTKHLESVIASERKMKEQLSQKMFATETDNNTLKEQTESVHNEYQLLSSQFESLQTQVTALENENLQQKEKISWMNVNNESNNLIKKKIEEMSAEKKQLAYDKGVLQTSINKLEEKLSQLSDCMVSSLNC